MGDASQITIIDRLRAGSGDGLIEDTLLACSFEAMDDALTNMESAKEVHEVCPEALRQASDHGLLLKLYHYMAPEAQPNTTLKNVFIKARENSNDTEIPVPQNPDQTYTLTCSMALHSGFVAQQTIMEKQKAAGKEFLLPSYIGLGDEELTDRLKSCYEDQSSDGRNIGLALGQRLAYDHIKNKQLAVSR